MVLNPGCPRKSPGHFYKLAPASGLRPGAVKSEPLGTPAEHPVFSESPGLQRYPGIIEYCDGDLGRVNRRGEENTQRKAGGSSARMVLSVSSEKQWGGGENSKLYCDVLKL